MSTEFWQGRKVLVTGCTGFLGGWLARNLVDRGADVVGLVRDMVPRAPFYLDGIDRQVSTVRGCLEDYEVLVRTVNEYEVDAVFHLAAQAIVGTANRNPMSTFETNIRGTWNLLEACRASGGVTRIVVASSDKAYGEHEILPYTEDHALQGRHPYDVSKSCADLISLAYAHTYGLPVSVTRAGNLFGPGDLNFSRLVPGTIWTVLKGERPIIRSDGSPVRDYVFVRDVVAGYLALAERMSDPALVGRAFNLGTGEQQSVLGLTRLILEAAGRPDLEPVILNQGKGEIANQYLSTDVASRDLGWKPGAALAERLAETAQWYREYASTIGDTPAGGRIDP